LVVDGEVRASLESGGDRYEVNGLPAGRKLIELWLPQWGALSWGPLEMDEGASVEPFDDKRPKWLAYGSSITMCRTAHSPTRTWPAVVAREMGLDLTNFGFGGQCHLDALVARNIRDREVDFVSLCLGINIYGVGSLSVRTFRPSAIGFIEIIREKHPLTPLVVMSPIICPDRETTPNAVGVTLVKMRDELEEACRILGARGDENVHYVSGLDVLGEGDLAYLPDGLHPSADGYEFMGRRYVERVARKRFV
jgi:lysophospholipase L1-like esterase